MPPERNGGDDSDVGGGVNSVTVAAFGSVGNARFPGAAVTVDAYARCVRAGVCVP